jgi:hypothetical protein
VLVKVSVKHAFSIEARLRAPRDTTTKVDVQTNGKECSGPPSNTRSQAGRCTQREKGRQ